MSAEEPYEPSTALAPSPADHEFTVQLDAIELRRTIEELMASAGEPRNVLYGLAKQHLEYVSYWLRAAASGEPKE